VKKKMVVVAALAALGAAAYLGTHLWAQTPQPAGPAPASPKIGMINLAVVLKGYNKFKVYNDEIDKIRLQFQKQEDDYKNLALQWKKTFEDSKDQATREKAEESLKQLKRLVEDNAEKYNKARQKKSDEQMIQMYKELELAVQSFAGPNGFHMILHYSEPLDVADKYCATNIQRKLVGPGTSGGVCPIYFAPSLDVSNDVINTLNAMFPAPAPAPAAAPAAKQ
jgi:Skp family chaperone for outer membrane proteins